MINNVSLTGRITADLQPHQTQNGGQVLHFHLAVSNGAKYTDFIPVTAFNKTAELLANHTGKGSLVGIEGRIKMSQYTDKQGNKRTSFTVIARSISFLEKKREQNNQQSYNFPFEDAMPTDWN